MCIYSQSNVFSELFFYIRKFADVLIQILFSDSFMNFVFIIQCFIFKVGRGREKERGRRPHSPKQIIDPIDPFPISSYLLNRLQLLHFDQWGKKPSECTQRRLPTQLCLVPQSSNCFTAEFLFLEEFVLLFLLIQNPFSENEELQQRSVRILGINTWDLALELTNFDWSLFNAIHEVRSTTSTSRYITVMQHCTIVMHFGELILLRLSSLS